MKITSFVDWVGNNKAGILALVRATCQRLLDGLPMTEAVLQAKMEPDSYKLLMLTQQLIHEFQCPLPPFDLLTSFAFRFLRQSELPGHGARKVSPEVFGLNWTSIPKTENLREERALVLSKEAITLFENAIGSHPQVRLALQMSFCALIEQIEHKLWVEDRIIAHVRRHNPAQDYEVHKFNWESICFLPDGGMAIPCTIEGTWVRQAPPARPVIPFHTLLNTELQRLIAWADGSEFDPFPNTLLANHQQISAYRNLPVTTQQTLVAAWRTAR